MIEAELHTGQAEDRTFDAIVLGAGLAGVAVAAILANRGHKVALIETLDQPGGRVGATFYRDCWIALGHRDADCGIGDQGQPHAIRSIAEREAGIAIPREKGAYGNNQVRVHDPALGSTVLVSMADITTSSGGGSELDYYRGLITAFVPNAEAGAVDGAAEEIRQVFERVGGMSEEEAWALVPVTMGAWAERNVRSPLGRQFLMNLMEAGHASPGEDASVGRWALCMPWKYSSPDWCKADGVGNMQTVIQPWIDAFRKQGGELWLGWKPVEIIVDAPRKTGQGSGQKGSVSGVVAINASNLVQTFSAPIVVSTQFGWDLPKLVDRELLPPAFLDAAEQTRALVGEAACWAGKFTRMPRIRATGETETFSGWQRVLGGTGLARPYSGGFTWPSLTDPGTCPKGGHLLQAIIGHHGSSASFADIRGMVEPLLAYIRDFYADFDECLEWGRYQWVRSPQILCWHLKPIYRHQVKISTVRGLYCAASSAEGMAGWIDLEAQVALQAARHIDLDFGRPDGKPVDRHWPAGNAQWAAAT